jgi:acetyl-CoA C-acetyltransferase
MKSVMTAQAIQCGDAEIVVAGGMENMSLAPHYMHLRTGTKFGPTSMVDGLQKMGLLMLMTTMQWVVPIYVPLSTNLQEKEDKYAMQSYDRSAKAWEAGKFDNEIIPVAVPQRKEILLWCPKMKNTPM